MEHSGERAGVMRNNLQSYVIRRIRDYILELSQEPPVARTRSYHRGYATVRIYKCARYRVWEWTVSGGLEL